MNFSLEIPLNGLSFGQTSLCLLREFHKRGLLPNILPIGGNGDLSAYDLSPDFKQWLEHCVSKALVEHRRGMPTLKLWHLSGALSSYSDRRLLLTFHETDQLTPHEINGVRNNDRVIVTSTYTKEVFDGEGLDNVVYCPLGFDSYSFFETQKEYLGNEIICFGLGGKLEKRKHHLKVIKAWAKKYGNDGRYRLNCAITNTHLDPQSQATLIAQALEGKPYRNINLTPFMKSNRDYNEFLNVNNIYIAMSGGEGFDLPAFQSCALGKHIVALNAHAYKDYLNAENAVLVAPSGKEPVYDGIFFHPNQPFNQGEIFTWDADDFIAGCEEAELRVRASRINKPGRELIQRFPYSNTADIVLQQMQMLL